MGACFEVYREMGCGFRDDAERRTSNVQHRTSNNFTSLPRRTAFDVESSTFVSHEVHPGIRKRRNFPLWTARRACLLRKELRHRFAAAGKLDRPADRGLDDDIGIDAQD